MAFFINFRQLITLHHGLDCLQLKIKTKRVQKRKRKSFLKKVSKNNYYIADFIYVVFFIIPNKLSYGNDLKYECIKRKFQ